MHADLINALGGNSAVAKVLNVATRVVCNWSDRGVSWAYRPVIAQMAAEKGIELPQGFMDPMTRKQRSAA